MSVLKVKELSEVEIKNGIVGINRDAIFQLIELIYFKTDKLVRNLIGMSGECVLWLTHPQYQFCRNPKQNLKKKVIPNHELQKEKLVEINTTSIIYKLNGTEKYGSIFLNVFVKEMILECKIKIEFIGDPYIYIGLCTLSQLKDGITSCIGGHNCGASLYFYSNSSYILCNGSCSCNLKEDGVKNGESIVAIINQKNNNNSKCGGKMNFIRCGKKIPHTITNISSSGVYFGFSSYKSRFTLHIISLRKLHIPPSSTKEAASAVISSGCGVMRCVAYDFNGGFENVSYNHRDEDGEKIPTIEEYYKKI